MKNLRFKAIIPCHLDPQGRRLTRAQMDANFSEVLGAASHLKFTIGGKSVPILAAEVALAKLPKDGLYKAKPRHTRFAEFTCLVPIYEKRGESPPDRFISSIKNLQLAVQIAMPGEIDFGKGGFYVSGRKANAIDDGITFFALFVNDASVVGWPTFERYEIVRVLDWLYRLPGFPEGEPMSRVGRAVTALSYLAFEKESGLQAVWAIVGLEALYAKGTSGKAEQILSKSECLLGAPKTPKTLKAIYDYRSRLLHGDKSVPLKHWGFIDWLDSRKNSFFGESVDIITDATGILVASIQQLIKRDWQELTFTYHATGCK